MLRINQNFLTAIIEAMPNAIYIKDENGVYLMINEKGANLVDKTANDFIGKTDLEVFPENMAKKVMKLDREVMNGTGHYGEEKVSDDIYFHSSKFMVHDEESDQSVMVGISTDISELKLVEEKLKIEREKAELANDHKSVFLQNMSHELRTPLNAIIGFSSIISGESGILTDELSENFKEYAQLINSSGIHLLAIINDLLDLSKIESGHQDFNEVEIDLQYEIRSCIQTLSTLAKEKNISVKEDFVDEDLILKGDETILRQVMFNLISNAIKYSYDGSEVIVKLSVRNSGGYDISVIDDGIGMSEDDLAISLIPFRRAAQVRDSNVSGTGLGLPLVDAYTKLFQGTLEMQSELGIGTKVILHFPLERSIKSFSKKT